MPPSFSDARPVVEMIKVTKIYFPDILALNNVSLTVAKGEMLFCTGRSGAGKTSLLKLICCLEPPTKGVVEVNGKDLAKLKPGDIQQLRQQIGVAYQDFKLLPELSVFHNVAMAMEVAYQKSDEIKRRVLGLLDLLDLTKLEATPAGKLSRGEQQRVALARAAANSPALLLADEPTGNLDQEAGQLVMRLFDQLLQEGSTIIVATHDQAFLANSTCRIVNLQQGRLHEQNKTPQ